MRLSINQKKGYDETLTAEVATMKEKKFKQVCECINCGNEAEMMITCSLKPEEEDKPLKVVEPQNAETEKP